MFLLSGEEAIGSSVRTECLSGEISIERTSGSDSLVPFLSLRGILLPPCMVWPLLSPRSCNIIPAFLYSFTSKVYLRLNSHRLSLVLATRARTMASLSNSSSSLSDYDSWSREDLIKRLTELESRAALGGAEGNGTHIPPLLDSIARNSPAPDISTSVSPRPSSPSHSLSKSRLSSPPRPAHIPPTTTQPQSSKHSKQKPKLPKPFPHTSHPTLKIALKFSYSGPPYSGLAFQTTPTPLPTVEQVLFDALSKARLIDAEKGFEGCGWERCGRTDRGVSAGGQVVSLWVRAGKIEQGEGEGGVVGRRAVDEVLREGGEEEVLVKPLRYMKTLNRLLPMSIRIHAWSPVRPDFSARFDCQYRHYKYFFTNSTFPPSSPSPSSSGVQLDIGRMQEAAQRLVGEHDFRNLCKLDAGKQIERFERTILHASITPLSSSLTSSPTPPSPSSSAGTNANGLGMYVFDLVGTAFLYHQVRHIMAVLFLIGTGLEHPSLVTRLLHSTPESPDRNRAEEMGGEVVGGKPEYQMADGLPLMLWDCGYAEGDVSWRTDKDDGGPGVGRKGKNGEGEEEEDAHGLHANMAAELERSLVNTTLEAHFLMAAMRFAFNHPAPSVFPLQDSDGAGGGTMMNVPLGGGTFQRVGKYVKVLERKRLDSVEVANERWRVGKGLRRAERRKGVAVAEDADEDE